MKRIWTLQLVVVLLALGVMAGDAEKFTEPRASDQVTIVTSDRLTYDAQNQHAVFEKNVVVTDPQLQLTADLLTLSFNEEGQAKSIEAEGNVHITQEDKTATAGTARYDVETGKVQLTGRPRVLRGQDMLEGDTITFWRDNNKLVCEPKARLVIYPQDGARDQIFGE